MEPSGAKLASTEINHSYRVNTERTLQRAAYLKTGSDRRLNMYLTIDTKNVTLLRGLVMNTFSEIVSFMKIEPVDHARKMKVCLCLLKPVEAHLMSAIMRTLPSAEFGRFTALS